MPINLSWAMRMVVQDLHGRNMKLALLDDYVPTDFQQVWTDVESWEVAGSGYPPGGKPVALDFSTNFTERTVDVLIPTLAFGMLGVPSVNAIIVYDDTGNPLTSRILASDVFADGGVEVAGNQFTYEPGGPLLSLSIADDTVIEP